MDFNKNIWIYWEQGWDIAPFICKLCRDTWIKFNQETWKINILDKNNISEYIDLNLVNEDFWNISPIQVRADIIRTLLLKFYGGVWVDATLFCTIPLDKWLFKYFNIKNIEDFFLFTFKKKYSISNWFMVSHKNNYIINTFCNNFLIYFKFNLVAKHYFQFYDVFKKLLKEDNTFSQYFYKNNKLSSEKAKIFERLKYDEKTKNLFLKLKINNSPVYKLTHKVNINFQKDTNIYHLFNFINIDITNYNNKIEIISNES